MNDREKLSARQQNILKYIWQYQRKHRRSPTFREIEKAIGAHSLAVPNYHVRRLEEMDFLRREEHIARGLRLTKKALLFLRESGLPVGIDAHAAQVQIRGTIQAGEPIDPFGEIIDEDETVTVDGRLLPAHWDKLFALRVRGDSMIDALVQEGDIVLLQQDSAVRNGDMVAAWLLSEEETTLKHFFLKEDMARLQPANPLYEPIITPASNVQVQGKVIMVLRQSALSLSPA
jgi:repressor LexA